MSSPIEDEYTLDPTDRIGVRILRSLAPEGTGAEVSGALHSLCTSLEANIEAEDEGAADAAGCTQADCRSKVDWLLLKRLMTDSDTATPADETGPGLYTAVESFFKARLSGSDVSKQWVYRLVLCLTRSTTALLDRLATAYADVSREISDCKTEKDAIKERLCRTEDTNEYLVGVVRQLDDASNVHWQMNMDSAFKEQELIDYIDSVQPFVHLGMSQVISNYAALATLSLSQAMSAIYLTVAKDYMGPLD